MKTCKDCDVGFDSLPIGKASEVIFLCPLHAATKDLLRACKAALDVIEPNDLRNSRTNRAIRQIEKAIAKASKR